jgi:hypothetical protein
MRLKNWNSPETASRLLIYSFCFLAGTAGLAAGTAAQKRPAITARNRNSGLSSIQRRRFSKPPILMCETQSESV